MPSASLPDTLAAPPRPFPDRGWHAAPCPRRGARCALLASLALLAPAARAQDADRAESPYFFVQGAQPGVDALPLKRTDVRVRVSGVIADVVVTQRYRNEGTVPIEARYVFPGSTRAAVSGLNVRVADRLVVARIREKQQARIEYDAARRAGQTAALLEQHRPNVFQMNVAHVLPGDEVQVELRYNELLVPEGGKYRFVFPTVVGPRYASPRAPRRTPPPPTAPPRTRKPFLPSRCCAPASPAPARST